MTSGREKRNERNQRLVDMVRAGAVIPPVISQQALFFPPGRRIEKDPEAIRKLFGVDPKKKDDK